MADIIEMLHITKNFPGIRANDDVTLRLRHGEIHTILGENGAGKSTLMSILYGLNQADIGQIRKDGDYVSIHSPNDANQLGIGMVHQHFMLIDSFTVLENVILGAETTEFGALKLEDARKKLNELSKRYGLFVDPDKLVSEISVGMQQRVEILKMLYRDNEIFIFDEPTALLTPQEIEDLMRVMRDMRAEGKSILFITHKLNEIMSVADRCTVLRKGRLVDTVEIKDVNPSILSELMVGRKIDFSQGKAPACPKEPVLIVGELTVIDKRNSKCTLNNISFNVRAGEIVCIAGIDGNGQNELVKSITGLMRPDHGRIRLNGTDLIPLGVRARNDLGLGHIPADGLRHGLIAEFSLAANLMLKSYHKKTYQQFGFVNFERISERVDGLIDAFDIRSGQGAGTLIQNMSGGNQQKAIVARELSIDPDLLIAVQPTRGLDIGAIEYIRGRLLQERNAGKAILLVSLELDEVLQLSDRILVMYDGEIVANLDPQFVTEQELGLYMSGMRRRAGEPL